MSEARLSQKKLLPKIYGHKQERFNMSSYQQQNDLFKVTKNVWVKIIKSRMSYLESESVLDSNFAVNSVLDFDSDPESDSKSESDSESDSSLTFMNLNIGIFFTLYLLYICTPNSIPNL